MKKIVLLLIFVSLLVVIPGCKAKYVMGEGSKCYESIEYNQYVLTYFRGRYVFHKVATETTAFKVTTYVEEGSINISLKSGNDTLFRMTSSLEDAGSKTYAVEAGEYDFILASSGFKGWINFVWDIEVSE